MTSTIKINALETGAATLNVGEAGQNVIIGADSIKNNVVKDAGGNAIFTSDGSGVLSGLNAAFGSASTLVSTTTASNTASVTYTLTNTYNEYIFECISINPVTDNVALQFQVSSDGTNYDKTITSTYYVAYTTETGSPTGFVYDNLWDQQQGTGFQTIFKEVGNDADQACTVIMHLFNPSSTTYIKNFFARGVGSLYHQYVQDQFSAGYINDTTAMTSIRFKMSSGNINAGKIKMYGIK
tara:strand:+ start:986 stop:1702 length:717 start_codon:yes stop_codon:yes gene_type:complete